MMLAPAGRDRFALSITNRWAMGEPNVPRAWRWSVARSGRAASWV